MRLTEGKSPNCRELCPDRPSLHHSNVAAMAVISKYLSLFFGPEGALSSEGIRLALDLEQVPLEEREWMTQKIVAYTTAALAASRGEPLYKENDQDGQESPD